MAHRSARFWILSVIAGLALLIAVWIGARFTQAANLPGAWKQLTPALNRDELIAMPLGRHSDMLELKGFDLFHDRTDWIGGYWQMQVTYETNGQVKTAEASYLNPDYGWLHRSVPMIP